VESNTLLILGGLIALLLLVGLALMTNYFERQKDEE
jgi:hypothetical protein